MLFSGSAIATTGEKEEKEKAASFCVSASIKVLSRLKTRQNNTLT